MRLTDRQTAFSWLDRDACNTCQRIILWASFKV